MLGAMLTSLKFGGALAASLVVLLAPSAASATGSQSPGGKASAIERVARHLRRDLNGILAQARTQLEQLSGLPSVQAGDKGACNRDMAARAGSPRYTALGAADLAGDIYCLSLPNGLPVSIADRAYFLRALGSGDLGVGDYQIGRVTGQGSVGLGFPVRVGGRITGITLSPLSLTWLDQRIEAQLRRPIRDLLVIDDHGTVLAHAGGAAAAVGTNLGGTALVKKALHGDRAVGRTRFGGKRVRAAFDLVPLSDDALHIAVTRAL
jgi:hypothetical protein